MAKRESRVKTVLAPRAFRGSPVIGVNRAVAALLIFTLVSMGTASGLPDDSPALNTQPVGGKAKRIRLGGHVAVRLTSGQTVRGYITAISPSSFTLSPDNGKPDRVIAYSGVSKVKTKRSLLPWIMAGVVAEAVVLIAVVHAPPALPHNPHSR